MNPQGICYPNPGTYDVQLIASNANGSDTLLLTNYITVHPSPPPQSIAQSGDTLFAIPGSDSYQWFFDGNNISGATDYFYVASASGDYNVIATDSNGCEVEAAIYNVIAGIQSTEDNRQLTIFPNPAWNQIAISIPIAIGTQLAMDHVTVYNLLGEAVLTIKPESSRIEIDVAALEPGLYFLEIVSCHNKFYEKFLKQ
jgi:hypothetical protein